MTGLCIITLRRENSFSSKVIHFQFRELKLMFNFEEGLWQSCADCNYEDDGTDIGPVKSKSSYLMVPRLPFTEWNGFDT